MDAKEVRKTLDWIEECYIDDPRAEAGHTLQSMHLHVKELAGIVKGLLVALEVAIATRPAVTILNGERK